MGLPHLKEFTGGYLSKGQVTNIKNLLQANKRNNSMFKAFDFILNNPECTIDEVVIAAGSSNRASAYILCDTLTDRLLEFMISDINVKSSGFFEWMTAEIDATKKLLEAVTLWSRYKTRTNLFEKVEKLCGKYELHTLWYQVLAWKYEVAYFDVGETAAKRIEDQLPNILQLEGNVRKSRLKYQFYTDQIKNAKGTPASPAKIRDAIKYFEGLNEETPCSKLKYFQLYFEFELTKLQKNKAPGKAIELIKFLKNSPAVYDQNRIGYVYDQLTEYYLYQNNLDKALEACKKAQEYVKPGYLDHSLARIKELHILFHSERYNEVRPLLDRLLEKGLPDRFNDQLIYFDAYLSYIEGQRLQSTMRVEEMKRLKRDYTWTIGRKLLAIMMNIDKDQDLAAFNIKALNKYRYDYYKKLTQRQHAIIDVLVSVEKHSFNFVAAFDSCQDAYLKMEKSAPGTYELIDLNTWFIKKMARVSA